MAYSQTRGHVIISHGDEWRYEDGTKADHERPCVKCGLVAERNGPDPCLGILPGVTAACCGHGTDRPYAQFESLETLLALLAAPPTQRQGDDLSGVDLIAAERLRHARKWTPEHDDSHTDGSIAVTAAMLACEGTDGDVTWPDYEVSWPSDIISKHSDSGRIRQLTIAGALIAAEIDRLQRADPLSAAPPTGAAQP